MGTSVPTRPGFCGKVDVTIANTTSGATDQCAYPTLAGSCPAPSSAETLASLASQTLSTPALSALAAGGSATYVITVQLDASATNADQGLHGHHPAHLVHHPVADGRTVAGLRNDPQPLPTPLDRPHVGAVALKELDARRLDTGGAGAR